MTIDTLLPELTHFRMPFQDNYVLWKIIGFTGILIFGSRFIVQWIYSEKHKESKVPPIFWWQSMIGTVLCLAYSLRQQESVFIAGYLFNLIPYIRNLMLIRSKKRSQAQAAPLAAKTPSPAEQAPLLSPARTHV